MESYGKPEGTRVLPIDEKDQEIEEQETEGFVDMNKTRQIFEVPVLDMKNYGLDSTDKLSGSIAEQIVPRTLKPIKLYRDGLLMPKLVEQPPSEEEFALRRKLLKLEECTQLADAKALIPMHGQINSLNVSVATGIILYEAVRQRS